MFSVGDFNGDGVRDVFRQERGNWVDGVKDAEVIMGKANGGYDVPIGSPAVMVISKTY